MLNSVQATLISLLNNNDEVITPEIEKEAIAQGVLGIISLSPAVVANNLRIEYAHQELSSLLEGIQYTTIKGCASALYYPNPILRQLGDVDFLVDIKDRNVAKARLLENEFELVSVSGEGHHWVFEKDKILYELHWEVNGVPSGATGSKIAYYLEDTIKTAIRYNGTIVPNDFHNGLIAILHMGKHMTTCGMGLRHLCDWKCYVEKVDLSQWEKEYRECGLWYFSCLMTQVCVQFLNLKEPEWLEKKDTMLVEDTMEYILSSGNFGVKIERGYETSWFSGVTEGNKNTVYNQFVKTANRIVTAYWPVAKKHKFLLPIGWMYFGLRYLIKIAIGKRRRFDLLETIQGAKNGRKLYDRFRLFIPD